MMLDTEILFDPNNLPKDERLQTLKQLYPECFSKKGEFLVEKFTQLVHPQAIEVTKEYYNLNWLGKSYAKLLRNTPPTTLLTEDYQHNQQPQNIDSQNLLIKGDNLEVLKHLQNAYKSKVKMIYIDPPYNTGSDGFVYQDDRKFTTEQLVELTGINLEEAQRILDFTSKKSNSHSAWLTFMYPRLYIARELLQDDGVIFISIDDNEQAQLKLLCDEVFGEENFVGDFIWTTKNAARGVPPVNMLMSNHEYILCYAKNINLQKFKGIERSEEDFANPDNDPRGLWRSESIKATGTQDNFFSIVDPITGNQFYDNWAFAENSIKRMINDNLIIFPKTKDGVPRQKKFLNSYTNDKKAFVSYLGWYSSETSSKSLMSLFDDKKVFSFPKSVELINFLINQSTEENSIVLDFFSGSGTTAHAVMQLNAEDSGNRKFILVQLPEKTDQKSQAYQAGYTTIFDITKARLEKVAQKIKGEKTDYQGDLGFKIFETTTDFREVPDYDQELKTLEHNPSLDYLMYVPEQIETLLNTWRVYDGQPLNEPIEKVNLSGYTAYLCQTQLYLLNQNFGSEQVKDILTKLDNERSFVIERIVIYGEGIDSAKQQELKQAIMSYNNKKSLHINILVRY
ncbi:site-specific DNA-methyltransferase [Psittacicella gerlachiana]|nr:site-specific DNA-methyltransferase [Psittacicella gerlachiana]